MNEKREVKVYAVNQENELAQLSADSLVIELPDGQTLEITWARHPDDPRPESIAIWGGRCPRDGWSLEEVQKKSLGLAILPGGGNIVTVQPYRYEALASSGQADRGA
jgi:hypothetical protein